MLYQKVRPKTWDEVAGNASAVAALRDTGPGEAGKVYLLHGPSGTGKTTMAWLLAKDYGCSDGEMKTFSFNAATNSPAKLVKAVHDLACHLGFASPKIITLEEADCLSDHFQAQLLDVLDESRQASIILCTTKPEKIIQSIKTRAVEVKVSGLTDEQMAGLLRNICQREQMQEPPESLMEKIIRRAEGSPRTALTLLENTVGKPVERAEAALADTVSNQQEEGAL